MYTIEPVNGTLAIARQGEVVLIVCDPNWEFAEWLCGLLSELGSKPSLSLTQDDLAWLRALDSAFGGQVHYA